MKQALSNQIPRFIRFGVFELDTNSGELRKAGMRVRLQGQPLQVLVILLERGGEVVTREEVRSRIWPSQSFGDTDHALNKAIARIREALGDSAETPRYIETLPRHGYRFIGALHQSPSEQAIQEPAPPIVPDPRRQKLRGFAVVCVLTLLLLLGISHGGAMQKSVSESRVGIASRFCRSKILAAIRISSILAMGSLTRSSPT